MPRSVPPLNSTLHFQSRTNTYGAQSLERGSAVGSEGSFEQRVGGGGAQPSIPQVRLPRDSSGFAVRVNVVHAHGHSQCAHSLGLKGEERPGTRGRRCSVGFAGDVSVSDGRGCEEAYGYGAYGM